MKQNIKLVWPYHHNLKFTEPSKAQEQLVEPGPASLAHHWLQHCLLTKPIGHDTFIQLHILELNVSCHVYKLVSVVHMNGASYIDLHACV